MTTSSALIVLIRKRATGAAPAPNNTMNNDDHWPMMT
jgi:hypothetical protein